MKKLIYLILVIGVFSCKNSNNSSTSKSKDAEPEKTSKLSAEDPVLLFEKTPCFGTCPTYNVVVYGNGNMTYKGKRFVKFVGEKEFKMSESFVELVLTKSKEINFFEMKELYDQNVTDLPSTITTVIDGENNKKITARAGIPTELKAFNRWIHTEIMKVVEPKIEGATGESKTNSDGKTYESKPAQIVPDSK